MSTDVSLIIGSIGAVTGIISLIWHIVKSRPNLKIESVYFKKGGFGPTNARGHTHVGVTINLRNLGGCSVTIEDLYIRVGNYSQEAPFFKPLTMSAKSSERLKYDLMFKDEEFKKFFVNGELYFDVSLIHTFGRTLKSGTDNFSTGYFTIR